MLRIYNRVIIVFIISTGNNKVIEDSLSFLRELLVLSLALRLAVRIIERLLGLRRDTPTMAQTDIEVIKDGVVVGDSVIPDRDRVFSPAEAHLEVVARLDMIQQKLEHRIRLALAHANDALGEAVLHIERLPARNRMGAHERMDALHLLAADGVTVREGLIDLHLTSVNGFQAFNKFLPCRRQPVVCGVSRRPHGIAANFGQRIDLQESQTERLLFIAHVRMPAVSSTAVIEQLLRRLRVKTDNVDLRQTLRVAKRIMDMTVSCRMSIRR